ncbi:hypothetical protein TREMEDRAFT_45844 [Tremella mesenterica DSM 1558]|uniref:uncharacterized protein n=1 Tax=Tremella mesenterica (strain ATCC 24925 / CBS 8224 / DSM 1558 / NBRC 9311 / NRRL Y-6157 / RJB 2259-6 / UBC 559-6) TaxID=578456 RepID=UPI00032C92F3|nr:uncharacterized protein TREMEDRAFT_45844 [Tremella mesenterica DSM 1558]EIW66123.1 hypothetical protein TREMEDRAFT_45844 [Tremella mesenterica DSM 1558]
MSTPKPEPGFTAARSTFKTSNNPHAAAWPFPQDDEEPLSISPMAPNSNVWAVKIPRFLLERWEQVREDGICLGSLVVDSNYNPPRVTLRLPETDPAIQETNIAPIPDLYDVNIPVERSRNTWAFSETLRQYGSGSGGNGSSESGHAAGKKRRHRAYPRLIARVQHEVTVNPTRNEKYLKILAQRRLETEQSRRPIVHVTEENATQAEMNQLASGYQNLASGFGKGLVNRPAQKDKYVRTTHSDLTNRLFALFKDRPYWGIRALRVTLEQPDAFIREVLEEIAEVVKDGQYAGLYTLKDVWKEGTGKEEMLDDDDDVDDVDVDMDGMEDEDFEEVV